MVEFVSYSGAYPNLCSGDLVLRIDGRVVNLGRCLMSGGCVWFDNDWNDHVERGAWGVKVPERFKSYAEEIVKVVNDNVPYGCCGGCI